MHVKIVWGRILRHSQYSRKSSPLLRTYRSGGTTNFQHSFFADNTFQNLWPRRLSLAPTFILGLALFCIIIQINHCSLAITLFSNMIPFKPSLHRYEGVNWEVVSEHVTHLLLFSLEPNPDGSIAAQDRLPRPELMKRAREATKATGCKLMICFGGNGRSAGLSPSEHARNTCLHIRVCVYDAKLHTCTLCIIALIASIIRPSHTITYVHICYTFVMIPFTIRTRILAPHERDVPTPSQHPSPESHYH